jgi:hypothetical protein
MSAWVLVLVVMATSGNYYGNKDSHPEIIGVETNTYAPSVVTIDFNDQAACETAAKTLKDADGFGTTKALCIARK